MEQDPVKSSVGKVYDTTIKGVLQVTEPKAFSRESFEKTRGDMSIKKLEEPGDEFCMLESLAHRANPDNRSELSLSYQSWYMMPRYRRLRGRYMADHPWCVVCGDVATDLDHITPHRGDKGLFWDKDNWQSLCHVCHSRKTARGE